MFTVLAGLVNRYNNSFPNCGGEFDSPVPHTRSPKGLFLVCGTSKDVLRLYVESRTDCRFTSLVRLVDNLAVRNILSDGDIYFGTDSPVPHNF